MVLDDGFFAVAPGRVCLFGEHSDYLGLDVISGAVSLHMKLVCSPHDDSCMKIIYHDLGITDEFDISEEVEYRHSRDYVRSAFNVLKKRGLQPSKGCTLQVSGEIPMAGGLSSSSALSVASILAFSNLAGQKLSPQEIAQMAFEAEVKEFGESGGMQDHYASAFGGVIHLQPRPKTAVKRIPVSIEGLVIGDSGDKKEDTVRDLSKIRRLAEEGYEKLAEYLSGFDQRKTPLRHVEPYLDELPSEMRRVVATTLKNRDLTSRALEILQAGNYSAKTLGSMIDRHHRYLRDGLGRSTDRIENLIDAAKNAGAFGCKINGSGGGGTMLAYCPERENSVAQAIERAGGTPYVVSLTRGAHLKNGI